MCPMLRIGRILVILAGVAAMLLSAILLLFSLGFGAPIQDVLPSALLAVAALVGIAGTAGRRGWGALLVAISTGGLALTYFGSDPWQAAAWGLATVMAIVVAIGLWRARSL